MTIRLYNSPIITTSGFNKNQQFEPVVGNLYSFNTQKHTGICYASSSEKMTYFIVCAIRRWTQTDMAKVLEPNKNDVFVLIGKEIKIEPASYGAGCEFDIITENYKLYYPKDQRMLWIGYVSNKTWSLLKDPYLTEQFSDDFIEIIP